MKCHIYHGRLSPDTGGTDLEGQPTDDWGFEGPVLEFVGKIDFTYGTWALVFESEGACQEAQLLTGWEEGNQEFSLNVPEDDGCIRLFNPERNRLEYFGDMDIR